MSGAASSNAAGIPRDSPVLNRRDLTYKALAGLAGGAIGWIPVEIASHGHSLTQAQTTAGILASFASMAILSGVIGALIVASEGQTFTLTPRVQKALVRGFIICFLLALPAIYLSNVAFSAILSAGGWSVNHQGAFFYLLVARIIGWALMGLMLGAGVGLAGFSIRNVVKGAIGGWVGGFIGGLVFDPISIAVGGGLVSRLVATCVVGLTIGLFIGLVQELTKSAWLIVEKGRLSGRQFRLEKPSVTLGRAEENVVGLFGDPSVQPRHAVLTRGETGYVIKNFAVQNGTLVNGRRIEAQLLHDGDNIRIGDYEMIFRMRQGAAVQGMPQMRAAAHQPPDHPSVPYPDAAPARSNSPGLIDSTGRLFPLQTGVPTRLGRALDNDIVVNHPSVSRHHAQIAPADGAFELRDLGSQNGTFVNGRRVTEARIGGGETVIFGDAPFTFRA